MDEALRDGEVATTIPLRADASLVFIGRITTPWRTRAECPRQGDQEAGPDCRILLDPDWEPALEGIEAHADLQVLYWMHEARRDLVRLAPRGGHLRGPFALRAPTRPNPIASSIVTLLARQSRELIVRGLDCIDGTPLLDIKPWRGCAPSDHHATLSFRGAAGEPGTGALRVVPVGTEAHRARPSRPA